MNKWYFIPKAQKEGEIIKVGATPVLLPAVIAAFSAGIALAAIGAFVLEKGVVVEIAPENSDAAKAAGGKPINPVVGLLLSTFGEATETLIIAGVAIYGASWWFSKKRR